MRIRSRTHISTQITVIINLKLIKQTLIMNLFKQKQKNTDPANNN